MSFLDRFRRGNSLSLHVMIRGRIGERWFDVDEELRLPVGTSLSEALVIGERRGIPFAEALANSPHLRDTLMLNGERCAIESCGDREILDGDELYLLAPIAGG